MPKIKKTCPRPWMPKHVAHEGRIHANTKFYQSTAWRKLREIKINRQPLCEECASKGIHTLAQVVDHILPINKGGARLDINNLQCLCHPCHNRKSGREAHLVSL